MNEQELEDKIWEFSGVPISKTDLWRLVKGDKKTCFDKIDEMVQTSQLKEKPEGNKKMYVRIDSIKKAEFEFGFVFQKRMLELSRSIIKKLKYPMLKNYENWYFIKKRYSEIILTNNNRLLLSFGTILPCLINDNKYIAILPNDKKVKIDGDSIINITKNVSHKS